MNEQEEIKAFDNLVPKCAKLHSLTWCVKVQGVIPIITLKGNVCVKCPLFVCNEKGYCDPLLGIVNTSKN